jgi:hypothetical protein
MSPIPKALYSIVREWHPLRVRILGIAAVLVALSGCDGCDKGISGKVDPSPKNTDPDAQPVNVTPVPTASVAAYLNPHKLPAYTGQTGSIVGTVTVKGEPAAATPFKDYKCPDAEKIWGKAFREGENRALADTIVAVTGYEGFYIPEKEEAKTITIEGCGFSQRTLTMTYGQRIDVKNETSEFWTPILEPSPNLVLRMASPKGDPVRLYPKEPGHWILTDRDRRYAEVDVYAFLFPLHTETDLSGKYRIDGVPVGKMKLNARHPRIDFEVNVDIDVKPGLVHKVDMVIDNKGPPKTYDAVNSGYPGLR